MRFGVKTLALAVIGFGFGLHPAAAEVISASFLQPDGALTSRLYSGIVQVIVSGFGQSNGTAFNDAFYAYDPETPTHHSNYYQLAFSTDPLMPSSPERDVSNFLVGNLPAYNADHVYTFEFDTGVLNPTRLHFGVSDQDFSDNSGSYTIAITSVAAVPEPSTWAMMLLGFAGLGFVGYRRKASFRLV